MYLCVRGRAAHLNRPLRRRDVTAGGRGSGEGAGCGHTEGSASPHLALPTPRPGADLYLWAPVLPVRIPGEAGAALGPPSLGVGVLAASPGRETEALQSLRVVQLEGPRDRTWESEHSGTPTSCST